MINYLNKLNKASIRKLLSIIGIGFNSYIIVFGVLHVILSQFYLILPDVLGIIVLFVLAFNLLFVLFIGSDSHFYYLHRYSRLYLSLSIASPLLMTLGNYLVSAFYFQLEIILSMILIYSSYFTLSICGFLIFFYYLISNFSTRTQKLKYKPQKLGTRYAKIRIFIFKAVLVFGGLYSLSIMNGSANYASGTLASSSQFSLALFYVFAAVFIIILKTKPRIKHYVLIFWIGLLIMGASLLPLFSLNHTLNFAEVEFSRAFGSDWKQRVKSIDSYLLQQPYSLSNYLLGIPPKNCIVFKDTLYYTGEGIRLYFDAYIPPSNNLPGNNSVIISIHGGGWGSADKGFTNKIQFNKYFAAQGYVVFDIQYGLSEIDPLAVITPDYVKGNFTLDDMIRHIGIFTQYLANNSAIYNANLNSVFITGGSSGGNLACSVGLSYYNTSFSTYFNPSLKIKGIIPFYPANGIAYRLGVEGSPELNQPTSMVNKDSPPCLLFHGTSDGIVMPSTSKTLKNKYLEENNTECALILIIFGGHVLDYYFSGVFNQICLYYMERFLYLYR